MSGRAGRLGHHENGHVILLPQNDAELEYAKELVSPKNDEVSSQLLTMSVSRTVLSLVAAHAVSSKEELAIFFKNTFYWHEVLEYNLKLLDEIVDKARNAIDWLLDKRFVEETHSIILPTPLGKSTSLSGLLPETANGFVELLTNDADKMEKNFDAYECGLIHWAITCPEFTDEFPSRFLPWASGQMKPESSLFMQHVLHLTAWDRTNDQVTRSVHALNLFIQGEAERKIRFATGISAGNLHRLALDISWILEGLSCVSGASDLGCSQAVTNNLSMLARRVRWGTPVEALDVLRIASRKSVPGVGRQRVMALIVNGLVTVMDVITAKKDQLGRLLNSDKRADALLAALSDSFDGTSSNFERLHLQLGTELGIREKVLRANQATGVEYDDAIYTLLKEELNWSVNRVDDGKRQNVPDIELVLGNTSLLIECKTVTKHPVIGKEEAFAVQQKAADYLTQIKRITLGKPDFDETSKKKAAASREITLVKHDLFMEGLIRVLTGRLSAADFVSWLAEPGVSELNRLPGTPTFAEPK